MIHHDFKRKYLNFNSTEVEMKYKSTCLNTPSTSRFKLDLILGQFFLPNSFFSRSFLFLTRSCTNISPYLTFTHSFFASYVLLVPSPPRPQIFTLLLSTINSINSHPKPSTLSITVTVLLLL